MRAAHALIEQFCDDAPLQAALNADDRLEEGDIDGQLMWLRVLDAIIEIRHTVPVQGQWLN